MNRSIDAGAEFKVRILKSAPMLAAAAEYDVAELARVGRPLAVQRGASPLREGAAQIFIVQSGVLAERLPAQGGDRGLLTALHGPGGVAGLAGVLSPDFLQQRPLEALANASLLAVPAAEFLRICRRSPELSQALTAALAADNERLARVYSNALHHSLERRLAEFFAEFAQLIAGDDPSPELNLGRISQSAVAEMLGVSREHVNKTLAIWERSGLLFQNKKGDVLVQNARRLQALAADAVGGEIEEDEFLWEIDAHLDLGLNQTALHLSLEALRRAPKHNLYAHRAVLATARLGAISEALALLERQKLGADLADEELACLRPRLLRDLAYRSAPEPDRALLKESAALYESVFRTTGGAYPGVNAAESYALAGAAGKAQAIAGEVAAGLFADPTPEDDYWRRSTIAECRLLEGDVAGAASLFKAAAAAEDATPGKRAMTRKQLGRLAANAGIDRGWIDRVVPQPAVMYFCGPMAWGTPQDDAPERETAEALRRFLETRKIGWAFGALASGADMIAAEILLEAGAALNVYLPLPPQEFVKQSVPVAAWRARYAACIRRAASVEWNRRAQPCNAAYVLGAEIGMGKALLQARQLETDAVGFFATQIGRTARNSHSIQNMMLWSALGNPFVEIASVWPPRPNGGHLGEPQDDAFYFALIAEGGPPLPAPKDAAARVAGGGLEIILYTSLLDALKAGLRLAASPQAEKRALWLDAGIASPRSFWDADALAARFIAAANRPATEPGRLYASDAFASVAALDPAVAAGFEYVGFTPTREKIDPCALYLVQG